MRTAAVSLSILMLIVALAPHATAAPDHEAGTDTFGSYPGDPRVMQDAGACYNATLEMPDTACSVLYGHPFDILNKIMINTQRVPDYWKDMAQGFSPNVGYEGLWDFNQLTMESSPGFVEYDGPDAEPELHTERGITSDIVIDDTVPIVGYWYLSADYDDGFIPDDTAGRGPDAGVLPCLTVRMTLQTGRFWLSDGDPLAVGEVTKTLVNAKAAGAGDDAPLAEVPCPVDRASEVVAPEVVTEFKIEMEPVADALVIPRDKGFIVHVEWWQWAPTQPNEQNKVYQYQWNFHNGPDYLNRVVLPTKTNVWIESVDAIAFSGQLYVKGVANSPWGSYDVDPESVQIRLYDESGAEVPLSHVEAPILRYSTEHTGHFDPVQATFPWDYKKEGLEPGTYTIEMTARNWQHLAESSAKTTIVIQDGNKEPIVTKPGGEAPRVDPKESPAPVVPALLALMGVLVVALRRRN